MRFCSSSWSLWDKANFKPGANFDFETREEVGAIGVLTNEY